MLRLFFFSYKTNHSNHIIFFAEILCVFCKVDLIKASLNFDLHNSIIIKVKAHARECMRYAFFSGCLVMSNLNMKSKMSITIREIKIGTIFNMNAVNFSDHVLHL